MATKKKTDLSAALTGLILGAVTLFGSVAAVTILALQSLIRDRHDPASALATLDTLKQPEGNRRWDQQVGLLRSEALVAAGQPDSARAVLNALLRKYPDSRGVQRALAELKAES